jgi:tetratricopeptide (TPR) repeat protein
MPPGRRPTPIPSRRSAPARARGGERASEARGAEERVALRLAIGREGIGLELAGPARVGWLTVAELSVALPGLRFPIDVSGGVARFRHRRGELRQLQIVVPRTAVARWLAPRLRGILGPSSPDVWIRAEPSRALVCVAVPADAADDGVRATGVLAFDVHVLVEGDDLRLVVANARGVDLPVTPTAAAIACAEAAIGRAGARAGAAFVLRGVASELTRALLPDAGARAPAVDGVVWTAMATDGDAWILHAARGGLPWEPQDGALQAREIASVLRGADDALVAGDLERARALCFEALERAPRHVEVLRRVAEIDARAPGRAEAALQTLSDARAGDPGGALGLLLGELLAATGDVHAALAALDRAAESEPAPALAARIYELAARVTLDAEEAASRLDRALARAPRASGPRWARVEARLKLGRLEGALADVEHLEALVAGPRRKFAVWCRAGRAWSDAGLRAQAAGLFERALRYAPDDPEALGWLGAALAADGRITRGAAVLARALELASAARRPTSPAALELARVLAEHLDDLPTAVAHVTAVPQDAPEAAVARGLEGRWRARLGDAAGAALAFARLRDIALGMAAPVEERRARAVVDLLREGASFEIARRHDPLAAQRHLAAALRLLPGDADTRRAYRDVGEQILREQSGTAPAPSSAASADPGDDPEAERRADELTRRLQLDPGDDAVADELIALLERLGRGHELLALLSARLDDASPERRAVLAPAARAVLERLAAGAEAAGRGAEASLMRDVAARLASG